MRTFYLRLQKSLAQGLAVRKSRHLRATLFSSIICIGILTGSAYEVLAATTTFSVNVGSLVGGSYHPFN